LSEEEAAGTEDRGNRRPDDVSGHAHYRPGEDSEATDENQVGNDTEGHGRKSGSDAGSDRPVRGNSEG
jgi:hypothetical protein